ncbi:MAG: YifB family Mg chelatase-like AAA ATPase [Anaerolineae bacterium]|nr:YifB family Mg chelatase-like AAA ATPase [Anaerolineae bacterium]
MLAKTYACEVIGLDGYIVEVETDFSPTALPAFIVVGLPDTAVQESKERVRAAIKNSGLRFPMKRFVVNLAPADLRKEGPAYDLAIAVGCLAATDQTPLHALEGSLFVGELSLDGTLRHVSGILAIVHEARRASFERVFLPEVDAAQAAVVPEIDIIPVASLGHLVEHLYDLNPIPPYQRPETESLAPLPDLFGLVDMGDIRGQEHVKRALEVAAVGSHNALLVGSPGVGKTLMARAMPGILPALSWDEALEVTRIYSVADRLPSGQALITTRPFRAPHHTISQAGLVGGGSIPKPGEVSLAHRGVLFLDEFPEFGGKTLEVLRQPLEDKEVTISRARLSLTFPANFMLIAAMNPCPCGYLSDPIHPCTCSDSAIRAYQQKISGPLLDRIDIHVDVPRVDYDKLTGAVQGESSAQVRARVERARLRQRERFADSRHLHANGDMGPREIERFCQTTPGAAQLMAVTLKKMQLSARAYHRILKLALTIADLDDSPIIDVPHLAEALQYRPRRLTL